MMSGLGSAFLGGAVGGYVGGTLTSPGGGRRIFGIIALIVSLIVALVFSILSVVEVSSVPGIDYKGNFRIISAVLVAVGILWLPLIGALIRFPWTGMPVHWILTTRALPNRAMSVLIPMAAVIITGVLAIASMGIWILLYTAAGLWWGIATASLFQKICAEQATYAE